MAFTLDSSNSVIHPNNLSHNGDVDIFFCQQLVLQNLELTRVYEILNIHLVCTTFIVIWTVCRSKNRASEAE